VIDFKSMLIEYILDKDSLMVSLPRIYNNKIAEILLLTRIKSYIQKSNN
jgi:hypothetical protein